MLTYVLIVSAIQTIYLIVVNISVLDEHMQQISLFLPPSSPERAASLKVVNTTIGLLFFLFAFLLTCFATIYIQNSK